MAVTRVLYASQNVTITTGGVAYLLPCQSASADETIPQEDLLVLGKLGAVARAQKDVATCKATVKAFLVKSTKVSAAQNAGIDLGDISTMCNSLRSESLAGNPATIIVSNNANTGANIDGFSFKGACSSIGVDVAKGAFPTLDLSFDGVGEVEHLQMGGNSGALDTGGGNYIHSAVPTTTKDVGLWSGNTDLSASDTIASAKFSLDMPTETLTRLGGVISGNTSEVENDNKTFSKPPFKATLTVDGQNLALSGAQIVDSLTINGDGANAGNNGLYAMHIWIRSAAAVSTRSFNQNVGDVGATFSLTVEGTDAEFDRTDNPIV